MGNKIYFAGTDSGPVQKDVVNESESVKFYCNEKFWITFDGDVSDYVEENPGIGWFASSEAQSLAFESKKVKEDKEDEWVIKIKFHGLPQAGLKYTVRLDASGKSLDPRVVPPKIN